MSTTRAIAWNTIIQFIGKGISTAIGVVVISMMTRHLGEARFGMYSTANAYFQVFAIMLDLGFNVMLVQMLGERAGDKAFEDRATSATFTLRLVTTLTVMTIAPVIGFFIPQYPIELKLAFVAIWLSFVTASLNQIVIGIQQRHLKMAAVATAEVAGRATLLGGLLLGVNFGWGLIPIVLVVSIGGTVNFLINIWQARRYASFAWNWDPAFWKILVRRAWPIGVSIIFNLIYFKADTLILSLTRPFEEVGIYSAAYRVLEILTTLPFIYTGLILPLLANSWVTQNKERFRTILKHSFTVMAVLVFPMCIGIAILGERVMILVAGDGFGASGTVLKILMLGVVAIYLGTISSHAVIAVDAQKKMMPIYISVAIVILGLYFWLIPIYGMWAAAWLTFGSEIVIAIASTIIALHVSQTLVDVYPLLKVLVCALLMGLAILPFANSPLIVPILCGVIVYSVLLVLSGVASKQLLGEVMTSRAK